MDKPVSQILRNKREGIRDILLNNKIRAYTFFINTLKQRDFENKILNFLVKFLDS